MDAAYDLAEPTQRRFALHAAVGFLGVARLGQARNYIADLLTALADSAASALLAPLLRGETSPAPDSVEFGELRVLNAFDMLSGDQPGGTLLLFQSSYLAWRWLQGGTFKKAASHCFARTISIRWQWTLDHALFDLRQPSRTAAPIAEVCKQPPGYHQLARLVLAAEPAVHFNLSAAGRTALREASFIDEP